MASAVHGGYLGAQGYEPVPIEENAPMDFYPPPPARGKVRRRPLTTLAKFAGASASVNPVSTPVYAEQTLEQTSTQAPRMELQPPPHEELPVTQSNQADTSRETKTGVPQQMSTAPQPVPTSVSQEILPRGDNHLDNRNEFQRIVTPPSDKSPAYSTIVVIEPELDDLALQPHYSEPYVAPYHSPAHHGPSMTTPQYSDSQPPVQVQTDPKSPVRPALPARALSAPAQDEHAPQFQPLLQPEAAASVASLPATAESEAPASSNTTPLTDEDEMKTHGAQRFFGNMLVVRGVRAGVQTVVSTAKISKYLSPWGDNNAIILPNVRTRDVVLAGVMHLGIASLAEGAVELVDQAVKYATIFVSEQVIDESAHHMGGGKPHKIKIQTSIMSLEMRISHKLLGQEAQIRLWRERPVNEKNSCAKGWFCPYLYASGRTPQLLRALDFSMAEMLGPGLAADANLAPTLLAALKSTETPITALCSHETPCPTIARYRRLALFLLGISPYRTASNWSQARIPNQGRLRFHLLTHITAIVMPVKTDTPVCAWSPWTLGQITRGGEGWHLKGQQAEVITYLNSVVDVDSISPEIADTWREALEGGLRKMLEGAKEALAVPNLAEVVDVDRAGVVAFRF